MKASGLSLHENIIAYVLTSRDSSPEQVEIALQAETFWDLELAIDSINITAFGSFPQPDPETGEFPPLDNGTAPVFAPSAGIHNGPHSFNMGDWNGPTWYVKWAIDNLKYIISL